MKTRARRNTQIPMLKKYTFNITIETPDSVDFPGDELAENLLDAIHAYDGENRLFNGRRLEDGSPCVVASSIKTEQFEMIPDYMERIRRDPKQPPFWDRYEAERELQTDISIGIDEVVEALRQEQAQLAESYFELHMRENEDEFKEALDAYRRLVKAIKPLLKKHGVKVGAWRSRRTGEH